MLSAERSLRKLPVVERTHRCCRRPTAAHAFYESQPSHPCRPVHTKAKRPRLAFHTLTVHFKLSKLKGSDDLLVQLHSLLFKRGGKVSGAAAQCGP